MQPPIKPKRTPEERAAEEAIRRQHAANPVRQKPAGAINGRSFVAILSLVARFKAVRECQGLTLAEVTGEIENRILTLWQWSQPRRSIEHRETFQF